MFDIGVEVNEISVCSRILLPLALSQSFSSLAQFTGLGLGLEQKRVYSCHVYHLSQHNRSEAHSDCRLLFHIPLLFVEIVLNVSMINDYYIFHVF